MKWEEALILGIWIGVALIFIGIILGCIGG